jgi:hypothetical protein
MTWRENFKFAKCEAYLAARQTFGVAFSPNLAFYLAFSDFSAKTETLYSVEKIK